MLAAEIPYRDITFATGFVVAQPNCKLSVFESILAAPDLPKERIDAFCLTINRLLMASGTMPESRSSRKRRLRIFQPAK